MAGENTGYQIASVTHGGVDLGDVIGANFIDNVEFLPVRFLENTFAQVAPVISREMEASVTTLTLTDLRDPAAKGTLVITLRQSDGGSTVISCTNMQRGTTTRNMNSPAYSQELNFSNVGTPVLSVSA